MRNKNITLLLIIIVLISTQCIQAFDAHKFDKCEKKGFCNRLRQEKTTNYKLDLNSFVTEPHQVSGKLIDETDGNDPIQFTIHSYDHGIFRLKIFEKENIEKRRETKDVLLPSAVPLNFKSTDDFILKSANGNSELVIGKDDFILEFRVNGKSFITFNQKHLLRVESVLRKKEEERLKQENSSYVSNYDGESAIGFDFTFTKANHLFGIPERATDLNLKLTKGDGITSEPHRLYNLDIYRYELDNPIGLYGVVPILMSLVDGESAAAFVLNPSETFVDISAGNNGREVHWMSEAGLIDIFFIPGPSIKDVIRHYTYLTGVPPLPQYFAIAYHQCRWNYKDDADVRQVDAKFDEHNFPVDVIWLDIEHTDQKKYFTWDYTLFPNPKILLDDIAAKGRKMVTINDPHIKRDAGYFVHEAATKKGYYVKNSAGQDFEGHCWPGSSSWLDFFNPEVRDYWASLYSFDNYKESTKSLYTWIDMNEPSVFSGPEVTMPKDNVHYGGVTHGEVHNQYGFYQGMATYQGHLLRRNNEDRPFVLSRSFFAGSQRYVAVWTGDNTAQFSHLIKASPMLMSLGLGAISFVGADVGGFFDDPKPELLVRWYQVGAFYPFFRAHAELQTKRREPWLFGEENLQLMRAAVIRRYQLLPYFYNQFYYASLTGVPILRPLLMEFADDPQTYDIQEEFLIGKDLLIKPVGQEGQQQADVYLPGTQPWYDYETGRQYTKTPRTVTVKTPIHIIPVFQRGGSILPLKLRVRRSSSQTVNDPYTLKVALDSQLSAFGELYIDDGQSFNYKNGDYVFRQFTFQNNVLKCNQGNVTDNPIKPNGRYIPSNIVERVVIYGYPTKPNSISVDTKEINEAGVKGRYTLNFDYEDSVLTIHKPNTLVAKDWEIIIN